MPRHKGIGMSRPKKRRVEEAEEVEIDQEVEPEPPKPFQFEPCEPPSPLPTGRELTRAEEHMIVLKECAKWATREWKTKVQESKKLHKQWLVACRIAKVKFERWAGHSAKVVKVSPMKVIQNHHKMTEEELKVAEKQIEWLYSVAVEKIAENIATQCKLECRDATIRSLRANLAKRAKQ